MSLPTKTQISDAVENTSSFQASQLKGYSSLQGIIGPESFSGGFCMVFPISNGKNTQALRVWYQEIDDIRERYKLIGKDIHKAKSSFLADVSYLDHSLLVDGELIDSVLMEWVDGVPLKTYIQKIIDGNKNDSEKKQAIDALAEQLLVLFSEMHRLNFSHGDLQHDNILVSPQGTLRLVDYDCFYTPSLKSIFKQTTTGYSGYQHPLRAKSKCNLPSSEKDDYFSELILYLSIKALAHDLSLWDIAKEADYSFLFTADDFSDVRSSSLYSTIAAWGGDYPILLQILEDYLSSSDLADLEPFEVLLDRLTKDPEIHSFTSSCGDKGLLGKDITLSWCIENYNKVLLNGKDVTGQTCQSLKLTSSSSYVLEVLNGSKIARKSIRVDAFGTPHVSLSSNKAKLHKGKRESVTLSWGVQNSLKITLLQDGQVIKENCRADDSYRFRTNEDTSFVLRVIALDEKTVVEQSTTVRVYPDATFTFKTDKEYVFPTIPFTLSWETKNAKKVELNGKEVEVEGTLLVKEGVGKETAYVLGVTDEFGTKEQTIRVKMLPIPLVESLLVPIPNIERQVNIETNVNIPKIELNLPQLPSLIAGGFKLPKVKDFESVSLSHPFLDDNEYLVVKRTSHLNRMWDKTAEKIKLIIKKIRKWILKV